MEGAAVENRVEAQFLKPVLLGESIAPYRVFMPFECVIPVDEAGAILDASTARDRGFDQLATWMRKAEAVWESNRSSDRFRLTELFDYFGQLTAQFPVAPLRVVYAKAGTLPAACVLSNSSAVAENLLYWAAPSTIAEARFLTAVLNSETARERTAKYQARGQWGARHFDKVIFNLPIPRYDSRSKLHRDLAALAERAEAVAAAVVLPDGVKFQRARALVRKALTESGVAPSIDALVARLLDGT